MATHYKSQWTKPLKNDSKVFVHLVDDPHTRQKLAKRYTSRNTTVAKFSKTEAVTSPRGSGEQDLLGR